MALLGPWSEKVREEAPVLSGRLSWWEMLSRRERGRIGGGICSWRNGGSGRRGARRWWRRAGGNGAALFSRQGADARRGREGLSQLAGHGGGIGVAAEHVERRGEPVDEHATAFHRERCDALDREPQGAQIEEQAQIRRIRAAIVGDDRRARASKLGSQRQSDLVAKLGSLGMDPDPKPRELRCQRNGFRGRGFGFALRAGAGL